MQASRQVSECNMIKQTDEHKSEQKRRTAASAKLSCRDCHYQPPLLLLSLLLLLLFSSCCCCCCVVAVVAVIVAVVAVVVIDLF